MTELDGREGLGSMMGLHTNGSFFLFRSFVLSAVVSTANGLWESRSQPRHFTLSYRCRRRNGIAARSFVCDSKFGGIIQRPKSHEATETRTTPLTFANLVKES